MALYFIEDVPAIKKAIYQLIKYLFRPSLLQADNISEYLREKKP